MSYTPKVGASPFGVLALSTRESDAYSFQQLKAELPRETMLGLFAFLGAGASARMSLLSFTCGRRGAT
jgi:hypothetical protein